MQEFPSDDALFALSLALLEFLNQDIAVELEQGDNTQALVLQGTLLRAFDTPPDTTPSISLMIGAHSITIRLSPIRRIVYRHTTTPPTKLQSLHIHLQDNYSLHLIPKTSP